jgi:hypothetical protein
MWRTLRPRGHFRTAHGWHSWISKHGGKRAGHVENENGYLVVTINYRSYKAHRLIWIMNTGSGPSEEIDHRNGDRADNRWCNLRPATKQENMWNAPRRNQRSLPRGVYAKTKRGVFTGRYFAKIHYNGTVFNLGYFDTPQEAQTAYNSFAKPLRGGFHHPDLK